MDAQQLSDNIAKLLERVRLSAEKSQRQASDIVVLAASKRRTAEEIRAAHRAGLNHFGESYLQEAVGKMAQLGDLDLTWHFIGHIQSNKTRDISEHFSWVHSVDRTKIARRLSSHRHDAVSELNVCIQVNIDEEASKSGVPPSEVAELARAVAGLPRLRLRGLMCLPAVRETFDEQRLPFARTRGLAESLARDGIVMDTLSMGMSDDFRAAIMEGATIVRIGTAVFGPRPA